MGNDRVCIHISTTMGIGQQSLRRIVPFYHISMMEVHLISLVSSKILQVGNTRNLQFSHFFCSWWVDPTDDNVIVLSNSISMYIFHIYIHANVSKIILESNIFVLVKETSWYVSGRLIHSPQVSNLISDTSIFITRLNCSLFLWGQSL